MHLLLARQEHFSVPHFLSLLLWLRLTAAPGSLCPSWLTFFEVWKNLATKDTKSTEEKEDRKIEDRNITGTFGHLPFLNLWLRSRPRQVIRGCCSLVVRPRQMFRGLSLHACSFRILARRHTG